MKKIIIFIILLTNYFLVKAQCDENCKRIEQIKSQKIAFITDKLQLTVEESQQFWPIYNEKVKKLDDIDKQQKAIIRNYKKNSETLTNKELETMSDKLMDLEASSTKIESDYYQKYKTVLPINKIFKLYDVERQFKHELLKQLKSCSQ